MDKLPDYSKIAFRIREFRNSASLSPIYLSVHKCVLFKHMHMFFSNKDVINNEADGQR